jgi:spoIIIJ-associated protein
MIDQNNLQQIKELINQFFEKTGFETEVQILDLNDKTIPVKIKTEDPKILIGQNGQTLTEIQHLLKVILSHKITEQLYIDLDINEYKEKKIEFLKETAKELADTVCLTKREKILSPMPSYERRIIHMELANNPNIKTESVGEGLDRRIVIRPC